MRYSSTTLILPTEKIILLNIIVSFKIFWHTVCILDFKILYILLENLIFNFVLSVQD